MTKMGLDEVKTEFEEKTKLREEILIRLQTAREMGYGIGSFTSCGHTVINGVAGTVQVLGIVELPFFGSILIIGLFVFCHDKANIPFLFHFNLDKSSSKSFANC